MNTALPLAADGRVDFEDWAYVALVRAQRRAVATKSGFTTRAARLRSAKGACLVGSAYRGGKSRLCRRSSSPRLSHDVDQIRLAVLDDLEPAANRACEILRVRDRAGCRDAEALRHLREVDVRIAEPEACVREIEAPVA